MLKHLGHFPLYKELYLKTSAKFRSNSATEASQETEKQTERLTENQEKPKLPPPRPPPRIKRFVSFLDVEADIYQNRGTDGPRISDSIKSNQNELDPKKSDNSKQVVQEKETTSQLKTKFKPLPALPENNINESPEKEKGLCVELPNKDDSSSIDSAAISRVGHTLPPRPRPSSIRSNSTFAANTKDNYSKGSSLKIRKVGFPELKYTRHSSLDALNAQLKYGDEFAVEDISNQENIGKNQMLKDSKGSLSSGDCNSLIQIHSEQVQKIDNSTSSENQINHSEFDENSDAGSVYDYPNFSNFQELVTTKQLKLNSKREKQNAGSETEDLEEEENIYRLAGPVLLAEESDLKNENAIKWKP